MENPLRYRSGLFVWLSQKHHLITVWRYQVVVFSIRMPELSQPQLFIFTFVSDKIKLQRRIYQRRLSISGLDAKPSQLWSRMYAKDFCATVCRWWYLVIRIHKLDPVSTEYHHILLHWDWYKLHEENGGEIMQSTLKTYVLDIQWRINNFSQNFFSNTGLYTLHDLNHFVRLQRNDFWIVSWLQFILMPL